MSDDLKKNPLEGLDPEVLKAIKAEIMDDLKEEKALEAEEAKQRQEEERKAHEEYVAKMKASPDPWVEIVGWTEEEDGGVSVQLDWNDPFVTGLRDAGITGTDDDQIVQKWITYIMADLAEKIEEENEEGTYAG